MPDDSFVNEDEDGVEGTLVFSEDLIMEFPLVILIHTLTLVHNQATIELVDENDDAVVDRGHLALP